MIKTLLFIIYYYKTCLKGKLQNKSFHIKNFFFTYKLQLFFLSPLYSFVSNPDLFLRFIFYSFLLLTDFFHCQKLKPDPCALQRGFYAPCGIFVFIVNPTESRISWETGLYTRDYPDLVNCGKETLNCT